MSVSHRVIIDDEFCRYEFGICDEHKSINDIYLTVSKEFNIDPKGLVFVPSVEVAQKCAAILEYLYPRAKEVMSEAQYSEAMTLLVDLTQLGEKKK